MINNIFSLLCSSEVVLKSAYSAFVLKLLHFQNLGELRQQEIICRTGWDASPTVLILPQLSSCFLQGTELLMHWKPFPWSIHYFPLLRMQIFRKKVSFPKYRRILSLRSATTALGIPGLVLLLSPVWTQLLFLTNPSLAVCLSVDGLFPFCSTLVCSLLLVFLTCFRSAGFCCRAKSGRLTFCTSVWVTVMDRCSTDERFTTILPVPSSSVQDSW